MFFEQGFGGFNSLTTRQICSIRIFYSNFINVLDFIVIFTDFTHLIY